MHVDVTVKAEDIRLGDQINMGGMACLVNAVEVDLLEDLEPDEEPDIYLELVTKKSGLYVGELFLDKNATLIVQRQAESPVHIAVVPA